MNLAMRQRRSLRGNVDRNATGCRESINVRGRSLRGNVDRNADKINALNAKYQSFPTWERG